MITITGNPVIMKCGDCFKKTEEIDPLVYLLMSVSSCVTRSLRKYYIINNISESIMDISVSLTTEDNINILMLDVKSCGNEYDTKEFCSRIQFCSIIKLLNCKLSINIS